MSEEELEEQIIQQIEVLVDELGGTMSHLKRCNSMGRRSKVLEIEYNIEEPTSVSYTHLTLPTKRIV